MDLQEGKGHAVLEENQGLPESKEISDHQVKRVHRVSQGFRVPGAHPELRENLGNLSLSL